jgi:hypothetical protein
MVRYGIVLSGVARFVKAQEEELRVILLSSNIFGQVQ